MEQEQTIILGAGITGLAASVFSKLPIYESSSAPGGLCASYYLRPGTTERLYSPPSNSEAYRFEIGGGHWLWGGDPLIMQWISKLVRLKFFKREAAVFLANRELLVPYPIQYHLHCLGPQLARKITQEMVLSRATAETPITLRDWLESTFGPTLNDVFFGPHNEVYTAGLAADVMPSDGAKSPYDLARVLAGATTDTTGASGYNATFSYPHHGLNSLVEALARKCTIHYSKRVTSIHPKRRIVQFEDGSLLKYSNLISSLPLNNCIKLAGLEKSDERDPYSSVLVINIGAKKGTRCPLAHWVYVANSEFHRVGFYSNVDRSFLPRSLRSSRDRVSLYVEKSFVEGMKPNQSEIAIILARAISTLQQWDWIKEVDVIDPTWVETAYTWQRPGSHWARSALEVLREHGIHQVGRYGRWANDVKEQGIAGSMRDGLLAGAIVSSFEVCSR